ncbi:MAG: CapA family protein [Bacteroidetes bacterium]|nr:MAG: CapA family protein [Bacteroidota bacterium]
MKYIVTSLLIAFTLFNATAQVETYPTSHDTSLRVVTVIGVGDMMLGTNYPSEKHLPPNDGKNLLDSVREILLDADITFGNLEGTLAGDKGKVKKCSNPKVCYAFRSPVHYAKYYKEAGFDLLSIANNHSGDFGAEGREITMTTLEEYGIQYAGLLSCPTTVIEKDGVKYGLAAFAPNSGTVSIKDIEGAKAIVAALDSLCDILIVSFHGGGEGRDRQHVTRDTEMFIGENRGNVYEFSHAVIDAGADIVFGHGPHVTRAMELYNNRLICYSLGNFATYDRFSLTAESGVAPIVKVTTDTKGNFIGAKITPIKQMGEGIPVIDTEKQWALKLIQELTKADFPETPLLIGDDGEVVKKQ